jgi:hypothetical protein
MPGKGKYTTYVTPKSPRRTFFETMFKGNATIQPQFYGLDQDAAVVAATVEGNGILRAGDTKGIQAGDPGHFPAGVDMTYNGKKSAISAPDTLAGKDGAWKKAGDPANSYVPDISSPGPGKTEGVDKDVDPKLGVKDLGAGLSLPNQPSHLEGYVPDGPNTGTRNPVTTSSKMYEANTLGSDVALGKSGTET